MKRNFNAPMLNLEGEAFKAGEPKYQRGDNGAIVTKDGAPVIITPAPDLTLRKVCIDAIGAQLGGDDALTGEAKFQMYELASRIVDASKEAKPAEVSAEEISTLKARIAKAWGILIIGPAFKLLDADYVEPGPL
jgi:hypothetical protein